MEEKSGTTFYFIVKKIFQMYAIGFSIASSNAAKERAFNISSLLLSDRRTKKMNHKTTTILIIICINNSLWNEEKRSELISEAVDIHMEKQRRKTLD